MKKTYCKHTDAGVDGTYCKAGHGESYGYCKLFPDDQVKCAFYESDRKTTDTDVVNKYKPGTYQFCIFGGIVYSAKIRAVGMVQTETLTTWHVQYVIRVGTAPIEIHWTIGDNDDAKLYKSCKEALTVCYEVDDDE